jgi:hypothetical protein
MALAIEDHHQLRPDADNENPPVGACRCVGPVRGVLARLEIGHRYSWHAGDTASGRRDALTGPVDRQDTLDDPPSSIYS